MREKVIYIATSEVPFSIDKDQEGNLQVKPKAGSVANAITTSIPEGYEIEGWLGLAKSPGFAEEIAQQQAVSAWDVSQNTPGKHEFLYVEPKLFDDFYIGATHGKIWPLIHSKPHLIDDSSFQSHNKVNEAYAQRMFDKIQVDINDPNKPDINGFEDVAVWAHEYHLFQLAGLLKNLVPEEGLPKVHFFHHETWPEVKPGKNPEGRNIQVGSSGEIYPNFGIGTQEDFKQILSNLIEADTIGFHTETDAENFIKTIKNYKLLSEENLSKLEHKVFSNSIGVPKDKISNELDEKLTVLNQPLEQLEEPDEEFSGKLQHLVADNSEFNRVIEATTDETLKNNLQESKNRVIARTATLHDYQTVVTKKYFNPDKIHFGSVSRFDYTKGLDLFLMAYKNFLKQQQNNGVLHPENQFQFNLVTGSRRKSPIEGYVKYQKKVEQLIKDINEEFPGSVYHYKNGMNPDEVHIFNAMLNVGVALSEKDGYNMSAGEFIEAINHIFQRKDITEQHKRPAGLIVGAGAGITEELAGKQRTSSYNSLSIANTDKIEDVEQSIQDQVTHIQHIKANKGASLQGCMEDFRNMSNSLTDTAKSFGYTAFAMANATSESKLNRLRSTTINKSKAVIKRKNSGVSPGKSKKLRARSNLL